MRKRGVGGAWNKPRPKNGLDLAAAPQARAAAGAVLVKEEEACVVARALGAAMGAALIKQLASSLEYLRHSQEYVNRVTFAPPRGGRPDGAEWLARRVQTTGRRVKLPGPMVRGWLEPCTFGQWMLFEENSPHTPGTMRRRPRDGRSGLPPTTLVHVSATEGADCGMAAAGKATAARWPCDWPVCGE